MNDQVYIGLGSNLGNRREILRRAVEGLDGLPDTQVFAASPLFLTAPWGTPEQPDFLNAVVRLGTSLSPEALLEHLDALEADAGRERTEEQWGPRALDLDLLLYGDRVLESESLTVPHPRMLDRRFVLAPLSALAPDLIHPRTRQSVRAHLRTCTDSTPVDPLEAQLW